MWFDTIANYEMDNEDIHSLLEDIAYDNKEYFCPDDLIDDCNSAVVYFGVSFSPSEIIKKLDPTLYHTIWDDEINYWIEETMDDINRFTPNDGETLNECVDALFKDVDILKNIVWKEQD